MIKRRYAASQSVIAAIVTVFIFSLTVRGDSPSTMTPPTGNWQMSTKAPGLTYVWKAEVRPAKNTSLGGWILSVERKPVSIGFEELKNIPGMPDADISVFFENSLKGPQYQLVKTKSVTSALFKKIRIYTDPATGDRLYLGQFHSKKALVLLMGNSAVTEADRDKIENDIAILANTVSLKQ